MFGTMTLKLLFARGKSFLEDFLSSGVHAREEEVTGSISVILQIIVCLPGREFCPPSPRLQFFCFFLCKIWFPLHSGLSDPEMDSSKTSSVFNDFKHSLSWESHSEMTVRLVRVVKYMRFHAAKDPAHQENKATGIPEGWTLQPASDFRSVLS